MVVARAVVTVPVTRLQEHRQHRLRRLHRVQYHGWSEHYAKSGPVAQLGARLDGIQEVTGSIPVRSTKPSFSVSISRK